MQNNRQNFTLEAIQFINQSTLKGQLKGQLTIGHDRERKDYKIYQLHWGSTHRQKISEGSLIAEFSFTNGGWESQPHYYASQPLLHEFVGDIIPLGASYLLVSVFDVNDKEYLYASRSLVNNEHLLPPSSSALEQSLAATTERINHLPVKLDTLWDPSRCPATLLPWLAWTTSVDIWHDNKDDPIEEEKRRRDLIRKNAVVQKYKGTRAAIRQALDALSDVSITLTEWWEQSPRGVPHTFNLDLLVNSNASGIGSAELNKKLRQAIDSVKPARSHYTFTISTVQQANVTLSAVGEAVSYKRFNMAAVVEKN
ncbi:phage tail protein I [Marinibactrum halimedae]|uniref:Phage tail protein I n=1 Tax=Marinibactrum halimedae TaxID=1444977 RepID=A0AA37WQJ8_9GAMM|nr:phage tail protein I [Marinibactrum halimedae]MCD9460780.1 phage tail protein I [Marinibactrum halimedae]GLS27367.1 hypothetical protein GCM10007877_30860 [Marinibactrum halimedae]